jgi:integrase/recombinase XerD
MKTLTLANAAQLCGYDIKEFTRLLSLPEHHPKYSKNLIRIDDNHVCAESLARYVKRSEERQGAAEILNDHDLGVLFDKCAKKIHATRNLALLALSNYCGLRAVEITRLRLRNILDSNWQLLERGQLTRAGTKNRRTRTIYLNNEIVRTYLNAHINQRIKNDADLDDYVFVAPQSNAQYARQNMTRLIAYIYKVNGFPQCSSHSGRARVATKVFKQNDLKAAQEVLGHKEASTTMRYCRYSQQELSSMMVNI